MVMTTQGDMFTPQILIDAILAVFKGKLAFMGSVLASSGAVAVAGTMPNSGQGAIGKTIDIPYFGTIPAFQSYNDGDAATASKLAQTSEQTTIGRSSLIVETTRWAQGVGAVNPALGDPYAEGARQLMVQSEREMDRQIVAKFATTPLVTDFYSSTTPGLLTYAKMVQARALFADEQDGIVAMVTHSQAEADIASLLDANGRPLVTETVRDTYQGQVVEKRFAGIPVLVSDQVPLTGSTMGTVTAVGTAPPTVNVSGTPNGPWNLKITMVAGGADGTATFKFSTDGGNTNSATFTVPSGGGAVVLTDTAIDSLVGMNGVTGVTATFAAGTYNANNTYIATANLKVTTMICQRGAGAFWYNQQALAPQPFHDIYTDGDLLAVHMYAASHIYRRRRGGARPGVVAIKHNVRNYAG